MPIATVDALPTGEALEHLIGPAPTALFGHTLKRLRCDATPLAVAVSGGPDSAALLLLAVATAMPGGVVAATVDHGLRPESGEEARRVAGLCARLSVPHTILRPTVGKGGGGLQAAARKARYAALAGWCPGRDLLVAHQRDDVAEALLMRAARGAGVHGLARMAEERLLDPGGTRLVRPLLDWPRGDLAAICARAGIAPIDDPSNANPRFDRTRARALLAANPWLDPANLARSAKNLASAEEALEWMADRCWLDRVNQIDGEVEIDASGLPHDTRRRLVERAVTLFVGPGFNRDTLEGSVRLLGAGRTAMVAGIRISPGPPWRLRHAPPRKAPVRSA